METSTVGQERRTVTYSDRGRGKKKNTHTKTQQNPRDPRVITADLRRDRVLPSRTRRRYRKRSLGAEASGGYPLRSQLKNFGYLDSLRSDITSNLTEGRGIPSQRLCRQPPPALGPRRDQVTTVVRPHRVSTRPEGGRPADEE